MARKMSAKARAEARKQRDKWKSKRWYTIRAPRFPWDFKNIGETLGESDEHIFGRVYSMTLQEFNGDFTKMHILLKFKVTSCVGQDAITQFIGHEHQNDHVRRQVRRYRGKVDAVVDVVTKDGFLIRMKPMIITQNRIKTSVKQSIRETASETIRTTAAKMTYADLQKIMLSGELEESISKVVKVIYPTKTCVIRKSQLLQEGVENNDGPTLDEIHAQEARLEAEMKAKKAALLAAAAEEDASVQDVEDEGEEDSADEQEVVAEETVDEVVEEEATEEAVEGAAEEAPAESSDDDLSTIPGVGPATVTKLQDAGFTSFASLVDAGVESISEVKGVSAALAEKIISHLS